MSKNQLAVLEQLSRYRFLTVQQMIRLGVSKSADSLRKNTLKSLQDLKFTGVRKTGKKAINQIAYLHYIKPKGAKVIADYKGVDLSSLNYPTGKVEVVAHIPHMIATVECAISVRQWVEKNDHDLPFAHFDFEKQRGRGAVHINGRPQSLTRINVPYEGKEGKEADFLFVATVQEQNYVYALELENYPDSSNIARKLMHYTAIIQSGWARQNFDTQFDNFVLSVHANQNTLDLVPKMLLRKPGFSVFKDLFLFNSLEQVEKDITKGWVNAEGVNNQPFI